mmetsp:Transcript_45899/g.109038  ORF Transcript_45899/g.109038 Transcript_45899/m.109038 type:complete len:251 (-) Transcript_45899:2137-2889(-)
MGTREEAATPGYLCDQHQCAVCSAWLNGTSDKESSVSAVVTALAARRILWPCFNSACMAIQGHKWRGICQASSKLTSAKGGRELGSGRCASGSADTDIPVFGGACGKGAVSCSSTSSSFKYHHDRPKAPGPRWCGPGEWLRSLLLPDCICGSCSSAYVADAPVCGSAASRFLLAKMDRIRLALGLSASSAASISSCEMPISPSACCFSSLSRISSSASLASRATSKISWAKASFGLSSSRASSIVSSVQP